MSPLPVMPDLATLESRLLQVFREQMSLEVTSAGADLLAEGLLDSLTFVDLLFRIEQEFGVKVSIEGLEVDQFRTVRLIAAFVQSQRPQL